MTKQEKILKQQIKELEKLVEIKDAVITELKTLVRPNYWPYNTGTITTTPYTYTDTTLTTTTTDGTKY